MTSLIKALINIRLVAGVLFCGYFVEDFPCDGNHYQRGWWGDCESDFECSEPYFGEAGRWATLMSTRTRDMESAIVTDIIVANSSVECFLFVFSNNHSSA